MDLAAIEARLNAIIDRRQDQLPLVNARLHSLSEVEQRLGLVRAAAESLTATWKDDPSVREAIERLRDAETRGELAQARLLLQSVAARFARDTINVGVSGRARVGKSRMLQTVSGLTDEQVPTGETSNVTATRSRIFHGGAPRAFISFHSQTTFLEDVVWPFYRDLDLGGRPSSVDAFQAQDLQATQAAGREDLTAEARDQLASLIDIQAATPTLRLDGGELVLNDLATLRRYVAYPTRTQKKKQDSGGSKAPRDYLSVRDCRVEAPFPVTALARLGLVDLPGLGEVALGIDERIMSGLREDVDVVLLVLRAATSLTNIDAIDFKALKLIGQAQGAVADSRDFCWIVINAGGGDEARREDLVDQVQERLNEKEHDSRYLVLTADASNAESVHSHVLVPVLDRLTDRLPEMDDQVLRSAVASLEAPLRTIQGSVTALLEAIRGLRLQGGSIRQELEVLSEALRVDIQQSLSALNPHELAERYVTEYVQQIERVHQELCDWLADGLGSHASHDEWIQTARDQWGLAQSHRPFANSELHRLRVEVTRRYSELDYFLNDVLVEEFYGLICGAISGDGEGSINRSQAVRSSLLGSPDSKPSHRIHVFAERLDACDPSVPGLAASVHRLEGIRFDFRLQSYPLLHDLNLDMRPSDTNAEGESYPPDFPEAATEFMYEWFLEEFIQFSFRVNRELRDDAARQSNVLAGAAVLLEDEVVRSGASRAEFRNLVDGYSDELWPNRFDYANSNSARGRQLSRAATGLAEAIDNALEVRHEQA